LNYVHGYVTILQIRVPLSVVRFTGHLQHFYWTAVWRITSRLSSGSRRSHCYNNACSDF
jgi:hypothetical protein